MSELGKTTDDWFKKVEAYVGSRINAFAAFMFLLIGIGALSAIIISKKWPDHVYLAVLGPIIAGIIAYENRLFAIIIVIIALILILI